MGSNDETRCRLLVHLYEIVRIMRAEQRAYFGGDRSALPKARATERIADGLIDDLIAFDAGGYQPALIGADDGTRD